MGAFIFGQGGNGSGGGSGSNLSVGLTGQLAPSYATEMGVIAASGFLEGVSASNPMRIDPTGTTTQPVEINDGTNIMGAMSYFGTSPGSSIYALNANASIMAGKTALSATGTSLNVNITGGSGTVTQYTDETAESAGAFAITVAGLYNGTDVVGLRGDSSNNLYVNLNTALPAGSNLIGGVEIYDAAGTNKLAVNSSGYITIANTSFASTQSGNWSVRLQDGSGNVITSSGGALSVTLSAASMGTRQAVSFTSSTPANTSNTVALTGYANVSVTLHYSGSVTGGQMYFEVSDDNSNWYAITMAPTDSSISIALDNYILSSAAGNITWQMFAGGYPYFRVRMGVQVVGAGTAIVAITPSTLPAEPAIQVAGISDGGTHGPVAVKSASVAATAADPALVVTLNGSTTAGSPANTAVTSTSSNVLSANTARREVLIVNTDVAVVYLGLGQVPTATAYHVALAPCSTAHDGTGGVYVSDIFKGQINAIVASTSGYVSVTELT